MAGPGVSTSQITHPLAHIPAGGGLFRQRIQALLVQRPGGGEQTEVLRPGQLRLHAVRLRGPRVDRLVRRAAVIKTAHIVPAEFQGAGRPPPFLQAAEKGGQVHRRPRPPRRAPRPDLRPALPPRSKLYMQGDHLP